MGGENAGIFMMYSYLNKINILYREKQMSNVFVESDI